MTRTEPAQPQPQGKIGMAIDAARPAAAKKPAPLPRAPGPLDLMYAYYDIE